MPTEIASLYASVGADTSGLKKGLEEAGKMLGKTEQEMGKLGGASRQADKGMAGLGGTFGKVALLLGGMKLGQTVLQLGALGAEAQRTEASFTGVAGGAEKATAMLDALKIATNGTKSEVELMSGATTIMALGLGKTADEIGTIMRNVEGLGARFGGNMQTFQLMMSNDSLMRIDSFGIGVEEATKRIEEYKKAGMDAGEAFDTAVMDLMTEKFESLGGTMDDNKASIDRMKASLQDLKVEIGQGLAPTIGTLATNMGDLLRLTNRAGKEYGSMGWQIADMLVEAVDFADWIHTSIDDMEELEAAERGYRAETARLTGQAEEYIAKVRQQAEVTLRHQIAMRSTNGVVVESLDVWKQYERAQAQSSEATQAATRAIIQERNELKLASEAADRSARANLIIAAVNSDLTEGLEERADSLIDLRAEQADILTQIEDLQGKLGGATEATTTFVDNTKKIDELKGKYGDLADEIAEAEGAIRGSIQTQLFQMTVSKMMEGGINDAELAYLELAGAAMGLDTTFLHLERMSSNLAGALADDALTGEDAAKAAERAWGGTASTIDHITKKYTTNAEEREAAYSSALSAASEAARAEAELGNAADNAGGSIGMMAGAVTDAKDKLADISPAPIEEVGSAAFSTGETVDTLPDRMLSWQEVMDQMHPGGIPDVGLSMDETGGKVLDALGNVIRLQQEIDALHGKDIIIRTYLEEHRAVGHASPVPYERNASGGWVNAGSASLVGERGPEMIYPTSAGVSVVPLSGAGADGGTRLGSTWTGDVVIQGVSDPEAAANAVIRKLADRGLIRAEGYR